ncbi:MAG TPA: cellulase family glycosylhydrolase [Nevskiaceae bacterium]|nr:cellulase family glycosylhydrolase [Nevskiaceae bacterium]
MRWPACCLVLLVLLLAGCGGPSRGPDPQVVAALARGVNLALWPPDGPVDAVHASHFVTDAADLARIRALGLRHVRVSLDPRWLADAQLRPREVRVQRLQQELARVRASGLFIVLALQPDSAYKQQLGRDDALLAATARLWQDIAGRLEDFGPREIAYELLNEPEIEDPRRVHQLMETLRQALREVRPRHSLVVAGPGYSDPEQLLRLPAFEDPNLIYGFHFYAPKNFTHQGAPYGWPVWARLHDLPYPASPDAVAALAASEAEELAGHIRWYGEERWNRERLAASLAPLQAWAREHGRVLWCSEFGVYRYAVRAGHREAWLADVRGLLEAAGIGWTHWDYAGYFGLVRGEPGARRLDEGALRALGLTP